MDQVDDVLTSVQSRLDHECPRYAHILKRSMKEIEPVYFRPAYAEFFWNCAEHIPNWLPRVVAACATTEGSGAHSLLKIWSGVSHHKQAEDGLLRHAQDEAGHARLFMQLARLCFEENFTSGSLDELEKSLRPIRKSDLVKSTEAVSENMLLDYLMQLNIVEIRTRLHLQLLCPNVFFPGSGTKSGPGRTNSQRACWR